MLTNELIKKFPIFSKYNRHTLEEFEGILESNRRNVLADIEKVNDFLDQYNLPMIQLECDRIIVPSLTVSDLFSVISPSLSSYVFQEERLYMIVIYLFLNKEFVSNYHLQELLRVSKNSVLLDLKQLKTLLLLKQVSITYNRQEGYKLKGDALSIRQVVEWALSQLLGISSGKWVLKYIAHYLRFDLAIEAIIDIFVTYSKQYQYVFISERSEEVAYLIALLLCAEHQEKVEFSGLQKQIVHQTSIWPFVTLFVEKYPQLEEDSYFLASRLLSCTPVRINVEKEKEINQLLDKIIELASANTGILIDDEFRFRKNLYQHLVPAYYRLLFGISLSNPLKEQIMLEYQSLFYLVKRSLKPLSQATKQVISDDEIAYFTMHFGGYLTFDRQITNRQLTALCVCPAGVASALMLKSELQGLLPHICIKEAIPLSELDHVKLEQYDMIFSTIFLETKKSLYVVQPFANQVEKKLLKQKIYRDFYIPYREEIDVHNLIKIIEKHASIHQHDMLKEELWHYIERQQTNLIRLGGKSLSELLSRELIQCKDSVEDWQMAIRLAASPLLRDGYIKESYIDGMITSVENLGAYIVLAPHVAVPHANPNLGVNKLGISLLQLRRPVDFDLEHEQDEDKQVQLLFVLAAVDSTAHLKALQQLSFILDDEELIDKLIHATNEQELYDYICVAVNKQEEE